MALVIDPRLREAEGECNVTENFNRLMAILDDLENRVGEIEDENPFPNIGVKAESADVEIYGKDVSDYQTGVSVDGYKITGTLNYVDTGTAAEYWGAGYFLCLKFTGAADAVTAGATSVKVGLKPSVSSGLVELLGDPDQNGIFKITDKDEQKFRIEITNDTDKKVQTFDLSGLTLAGNPT